jgi:DNA-binding NtrC family response regulator
VPILPVVVSGDTFASVWSGLANELGMQLHIASATSELPSPGDCLPPIIVAAGREGDVEDDIRNVLRSGFAPPITVGVEPDHRLAVRLLRAGAADYFALPADLATLQSSVADAAARIVRRSDRERTGEAIRSDYDFGQIVGRSPALRTALERAARIIPHDRASVLVTGETGTGKELVARAIHFNGPRRLGAFVEINCAAIPGNLLESELFGYERGAFTDARTTKPGLFEAADGGTLFLDEIGHMPLTVQGKLLKAIEEKRVRRLGSLQSREIDLRIIAATHVDLASAVERGNFREDLYYRLTLIPIHLPPLRERGDDILLIAQHFLRKLTEQYALPLPTIDNGLRAELLRHSWPGNVRELRNTLERALLLGDGRLDPSDLFFEQRTPNRLDQRAPALPFPAPLAEIEREAALAMVARFDGNKSAAASALQISRSRLYRLLGEPEPDSLPPVSPEMPTP